MPELQHEAEKKKDERNLFLHQSSNVFKLEPFIRRNNCEIKPESYQHWRPLPLNLCLLCYTQGTVSAYNTIIPHKNICIRVWSLGRRIWWWWRNMNYHLALNGWLESSWIFMWRLDKQGHIPARRLDKKAFYSLPALHSISDGCIVWWHPMYPLK